MSLTMLLPERRLCSHWHHSHSLLTSITSVCRQDADIVKDSDAVDAVHAAMNKDGLAPQYYPGVMSLSQKLRLWRSAFSNHLNFPQYKPKLSGEPRINGPQDATCTPLLEYVKVPK
ncbi:MAG: hypothetical protein Q9214_000819 [Letrouitia sp. 1 TL-2023]